MALLLSDTIPTLFNTRTSLFTSGIAALDGMLPEGALSFGDIIEMRASSPCDIGAARMALLKPIIIRFLTQSSVQQDEGGAARPGPLVSSPSGGCDDVRRTSSHARVLYLSTRPELVPVAQIISEIWKRGGCRPAVQTCGAREDGGCDETEEMLLSAAHALEDALEVHRVESTSDVIGVLQRHLCATPVANRKRARSPREVESPHEDGKPVRLLVVVDHLVDIFSHPSVQHPRGAGSGAQFIIRDFARALRSFFSDVGVPCAMVALNALVGWGGMSAGELHILNRACCGGAGWVPVADVILVVANQPFAKHQSDEDVAVVGRLGGLRVTICRGGNHVGESVTVRTSFSDLT